MMYSNKSKKSSRFGALALIPAVVAAVAVTDIPAIASGLSEIRSATFIDNKTAVAVENIATNQSVVADKGSKNVAENEKSTKDKPSVDVSQIAEMPSYPGGNEALYIYLAENILYPEDAKDAGIEGKVLISFTIKADGSVTDVEVRKGVSESIDKEAIRVVQNMGRWLPARLKSGEAVSVSFALPISFKLKSDDKPSEN